MPENFIDILLGLFGECKKGIEAKGLLFGLLFSSERIVPGGTVGSLLLSIHTLVNGNMRSPSYATILGWMSEIWAGFSEDLIRASFEECGIVSSQCADPYHSALAKVLDGVDIREYLEDVVESSDDEPDQTDMALSFHDSDSDVSDDDFVPTDGETTTDSDDSGASDEGIAQLLNQSTIEDDFDEPPIPQPLPPKSKDRNMHGMRRDLD
jgi:hypothetical protein